MLVILDLLVEEMKVTGLSPNSQTAHTREFQFHLLLSSTNDISVLPFIQMLANC